MLYFLVFRLWFDELMGLWVSVQNLPSWEGVSIWAIVLKQQVNFNTDSLFFFFPSLFFFFFLHQNLVNLFARLANDNIGYINWDPFIPKVLKWIQIKSNYIFRLVVLLWGFVLMFCVLWVDIHQNFAKLQLACRHKSDGGS